MGGLREEGGVFMGQKPVRMRKRAEFLRAASKGRKVAMPGLVMQVLPHQDAGEPRVGFTVTKKVGNAVVRNRTKRRLRAALQVVAKGETLAAADFVLIGRDQTRFRRFSELTDDVRRAMKKGGGLVS